MLSSVTRARLQLGDLDRKQSQPDAVTCCRFVVTTLRGSGGLQRTASFLSPGSEAAVTHSEALLSLSCGGGRNEEGQGIIFLLKAG